MLVASHLSIWANFYLDNFCRDSKTIFFFWVNENEVPTRNVFSGGKRFNAITSLLPSLSPMKTRDGTCAEAAVSYAMPRELFDRVSRALRKVNSRQCLPSCTAGLCSSQVTVIPTHRVRRVGVAAVLRQARAPVQEPVFSFFRVWEPVIMIFHNPNEHRLGEHSWKKENARLIIIDHGDAKRSRGIAISWKTSWTRNGGPANSSMRGLFHNVPP